MLRADTALRIFPGGTMCEVEVPAWTGINGQPHGEEPDTWNDEFLPTWENRSVGHGATGGFVIATRPGVASSD